MNENYMYFIIEKNNKKNNRLKLICFQIYKL